MKNKLFMVYDIHEIDGYVNIVSAPTARLAKEYGSNIEFTESAEHYIDLRVKAIKGGMLFQYDNNSNVYYMSIKGDGFVYTDISSGLIDFFNGFIPELIKLDRFQVEDN